MTRYTVTLAGRTHEVVVDDDGLTVDGAAVDASLSSIEGTAIHALTMGIRSHRIVATRGGDGSWALDVDGRPVRADVVDERTRRLREMAGALAGSDGPRPIKAPMPGLVVKVEVAEGDSVEAGQGIVIVEAMKMENELKAEVAARVGTISVQAGDTVEKDQILVELLPPADEAGE